MPLLLLCFKKIKNISCVSEVDDDVVPYEDNTKIFIQRNLLNGKVIQEEESEKAQGISNIATASSKKYFFSCVKKIKHSVRFWPENG